MPLDVAPLSRALSYGCRVGGLTFALLQDSNAGAALRRLLRDQGLIVFTGVEPGNRVQHALSAALGPIKDYAGGARITPGAGLDGGVAEIVTDGEKSTLVEIEGERLSGWLPWHFDQCYNADPCTARVLQCGRSPPARGLTGFLDGEALYRSIAPDLRARVEGLSVRYAREWDLRRLRFGVPEGFHVVHAPDHLRPAGAPDPQMPAQASHPCVRLSPSGEKRLHVSPWMAAGINGMDDPASSALLEAVGREILRLAGTVGYFHSWQPGDMLIWDNLRMIHSATGHDPSFTRVMYRSTITAAWE